MLPELWRDVKRLVLACSIDEASLLTALNPTFRSLGSMLATRSSHLLLLHAQRHAIFVLTPEFEISSLDKWIAKSQAYTSTELIATIATFSFDAAIILTAPSQSPFSLAYLCYLAGVPIRLGQSQEFGGGVLSHCVTPLPEYESVVAYHHHLLRSTGLTPQLNEFTRSSV